MQFGADTNKVIFAQALSGADQDDSFSPRGGGRTKDWRIFTTKEQLLPRQVEYSVFSRLFVLAHIGVQYVQLYMLRVSVLRLNCTLFGKWCFCRRTHVCVSVLQMRWRTTRVDSFPTTRPTACFL
jgi:hypothetical protein